MLTPTVMIPLLLALLLAPQDKPPEKCALSGTVADSVTGEPLAKVEITLTRLSDNYHPAGTTSIEHGRFAIVDLDPGDYRLSGVRSGYLETAYGTKNTENQGAVLHVKAGESLTDISLKLIPGGVISGTVRDSDGEPVEDVDLSLSRRTYGPAGPTMEAYDSTNTDDLGQYRFRKLPPGKYYVSARKRFIWWNFEIYSPPPGPQYDSVETFYPGVADIAGATPVTVTVGGQVSGTDIKMLRRPVFHVSGQVISSGAMPGEVSLLRAGEAAHATGFHMATFVRDTGDFVFDRVPSGSYTLLANGSMVTSTALQVSDKDLEGVRVIAAAPGEISGRIVVEGDGKFLPNGSVFMTSDGRNGSRVMIAADQTFHGQKLAPGKYRLKIFSNQMLRCYVKTIRVGGVDSSSESVDVASGATSTVEIVLGADGALVAGTVHGKDGALAPSATVVLIPDGPLAARTDLYQVASTDQFGNFQLDNVAPGLYKALAWDEVQSNQWLDPEFISQYMKYAFAWEVKPNAPSTLSLNLASR